jgi:hypothetical protein
MPSKKLDLTPIILKETRIKHPAGRLSKDGMIPGYTVECHQCHKPFEVAKGDINRGRGLFCSRICSGNYRRRTPEQIFNEYTQRDEDCWIWTGWKNPLGYGHLNLADGTRWLAHRLSWVIHFGDIPDKLVICHSCDNPSCVNPSHLFIGTQKDNVQDAIKKGRPGYLDWRRSTVNI